MWKNSSSQFEAVLVRPLPRGGSSRVESHEMVRPFVCELLAAEQLRDVAVHTERRRELINQKAV